jgi:hypothetical protein
MLTHFDEKGKIFTPVVSKTPVQVTLQTTLHQIHGNIHIRPDERVKSALDNMEESFLAITEAEAYDNTGKLIIRTNLILIHRSQIIWVVPDEEIRAEESL